MGQEHHSVSGAQHPTAFCFRAPAVGELPETWQVKLDVVYSLHIKFGILLFALEAERKIIRHCGNTKLGLVLEKSPRRLR